MVLERAWDGLDGDESADDDADDAAAWAQEEREQLAERAADLWRRSADKWKRFFEDFGPLEQSCP